MLGELRKEIDNCDNAIIMLLKKRMEISKKIGMVKMENGLHICDEKREQDLMEKLGNMANEVLSKEAINNIYMEILSASKELQNKSFR